MDFSRESALPLWLQPWTLSLRKFLLVIVMERKLVPPEKLLSVENPDTSLVEKIRSSPGEGASPAQFKSDFHFSNAPVPFQIFVAPCATQGKSRKAVDM